MNSIKRPDELRIKAHHISLNKLITAISRLWDYVHADHVEPRQLVTLGASTSAAEEVEEFRLIHASPQKRPGALRPRAKRRFPKKNLYGL